MVNTIYVYIDTLSESGMIEFNGKSFAESRIVAQYNKRNIAYIRTELEVSDFSSLPDYIAGSDADLAVRYPDIAKLVLMAPVIESNQVVVKPIGQISDLSKTVGPVQPPVVYSE